MIYNRRRGDRLSCSWGALYKTHASLEHCLGCSDLRVIQFGETRYRELLRDILSDYLGLYVVSEQPMVQVARHRGFLCSECTHGFLHPVERCRFPHKVHHEAVVLLGGAPP